MSNIISVSKRLLRADTVAASSVSPKEGGADDTLEAVLDLLGEEREVETGPFAELAMTVTELSRELRARSIASPLNRRELLLWVVLEVMDTEVGVEDLAVWVSHRPTLREIAFADGDSLLAMLLKADQSASVRYNQLQKKHL